MAAKIRKIIMPIDNHEQASFWVKLGFYITGTLLGLGTKLAIINQQRQLTIKDFILHSFVAFACAWLVWAILAHYDHIDLANIASVIVGRYGDQILLLVWKAIKTVIVSFTKNPNIN